MLIKILRTHSLGSGRVATEGDVLDIPEVDAQYKIEQGIAVAYGLADLVDPASITQATPAVGIHYRTRTQVVDAASLSDTVNPDGPGAYSLDSNRVVLILVNLTRGAAGTAPSMVSATYGAVAMTKAWSGEFGTDPTRQEAWYLVNPPTGGSKVCAITFSQAVHANVEYFFLSGVDQSIPIGAVGAASGSNTFPAVTISPVTPGSSCFSMLTMQGVIAYTPNAGEGFVDSGVVTDGTHPDCFEYLTTFNAGSTSASFGGNLATSQPWLLFAIEVRVAYPPPLGIWISPAEIMALPITGAALTAWNALVTAADASHTVVGTGTWGFPDLSVQNKHHAAYCMAGALVAVRTNNATLKAKVRDNIIAAKRTMDEPGPLPCGGAGQPVCTEWNASATRTLGVGRQISGYVVAADIIDLKNYDSVADAEFRQWLSIIGTTVFPKSNVSYGQTIVRTHESTASWGCEIGHSRVAIALYLGDTVGLARSYALLKSYSARGFYPTGVQDGPGDYFINVGALEPTWACDPSLSGWLAISPSCTKTWSVAIETTTNGTSVLTPRLVATVGGCSTVLNSKNLTTSNDFLAAGVQIGMPIVGTNIPVGTTVVSVTATTIGMSVVATGSGSGLTVTFFVAAFYIAGQYGTTEGIHVGDKITGTGIPASTTVLSFASPTSMTMSAAATDSTTGSRTFTSGPNNIDGALITEASRQVAGGNVTPFVWPPYAEGLNYMWEALDGVFMAAEMLYRAGYTDVYTLGSNSLKRCMDFIALAGTISPRWGGLNYPQDMNIIWIANKRYGTSYPTNAYTAPLPWWSYGWTNWTHA